jgi:hypothetical protein
MARRKKAAISSETPLPALGAYSAACWTLALTPYFAETLDARITAYEWWQANQPTSLPLSSMEAVGVYIVVYWGNYWLNRWPDTIERLEREDANALADDLAARLDAEPKVIRDKLRTLRNDLYQLNDPRNDGWNETQRAEAETEVLAAFAEKLEDLYAAALAKSRRSAVQKAATKRRVRKALVEVRKEHPGAKEHRIDELAASKANVGERTLQRYKPRR